MTNNGHDLLAALGSLTSTAAKSEIARRNRPYGRPAIIAFTGGKIAAMRVTPRTNKFKQETDHVEMDITGATVVRSVSPMQSPANFTLWMEVPKVRFGDRAGELNLDVNSEMIQMQLSATAINEAVQSIPHLQGRTIDAEEAVHKYTYNKWVEAIDGPKTATRNGVEQRGDYQPVDDECYFFKVTRVVDSSQQQAVVAQPSDITLVKAIKYVETLAATNALDGLSNVTATLKDLQTAGINFTDPANAALQSAVVGKKLPEFLGIKAEVTV